MSNLQVIISRKTRLAKFSGAGTYQAKEVIKQLGQARFVGTDKSWEVSKFETSDEELTTLFPGILILEEDTLAAVAVKSETKTVPSSELAVPAGLSVGQFLGRVRGVLRAAFPGTFCIYGVLSEVDHSSGGRVFLELKESAESDERVRGVIWQDAEKLCEGLTKAGFKLEPDLQVMFEVSIQVNRRGAYVSLSIERIIVEYTIGKIAALREQTNERLKKEGIFAQNKEKQLPFLPRRLGILTSAGGTVIHDFRASLDIGNFGFELFWRSVSVQGSEAKQSILQGMSDLLKLGNLDAILIFRGGGGQAELAVFNDYEIAKAVCLCPIPVLSAIGHEEDQSSVQDVSAYAFGVPKDLGRFFADRVLEYRMRFRQASDRILALASYAFETSTERLNQRTNTITNFLEQSLSHLGQGVERVQALLPTLAGSVAESRARRFHELASPLAFLGYQVSQVASSRFASVQREAIHRADILLERKSAELGQMYPVVREIARFLENRETRISGFEELLAAVSPEVQLRRGFTLVRDPKSKQLVTASKNLRTGAEVIIEFHDGTKSANITSKE